MKTLADGIAVAGRFARSANLERDSARREPLDGYVVTARALDVVERIAGVAAAGPAGGAWSVTGPYGSGKSSLALLIDAALGAVTPARSAAMALIEGASPDAARLVRNAHSQHGTEKTGFHSALVTADKQPLNHTVLRALHSAVVRRYGRIPSAADFAAARTLRAALHEAASDDPRRSGPSPSALVEIARCLASEAPLLMMIDEFGKTLEAFNESPGADPYLLQQLAEAGQSNAGVPIFLLTFQHLSFEDYLGGSDRSQRREWAKVQGRFEDISYVESSAQTRALIKTVFQITDPHLRERIEQWALPYSRTMRMLGIADLADPETIAFCYPLHPLATLVLPELCKRYGQHERSLFSFLTDPDPASAASFLSAHEPAADRPLPSVGLDRVYDYFVSRATATRSSRWTEMAVRIRDTHGLSRAQERLAKTIALLNLVSTTGTVRASRGLLKVADPDAAKTVAELENAGMVTYRDFADEYRIWHGTDIDIHRLLETSRRLVRPQPLAEILSRIVDLPPVVAARHSAQNQLLRVFKRRYATGRERVEPLDAFAPYDGEVLLLVESTDTTPALVGESAHLAKPVMAAFPSDLAELDVAAREVAAVRLALDEPAIAEDWVARRELGERLAQAQSILDQNLASTFHPDSCRWVLLNGHQDQIDLETGRGSAPISAAADHAYDRTPIVRNEMLNRTALTSQGAKARRIVIESMIDHGDEPDLGLEGYGPEMAMYRSFLERTGIHGHDMRNYRMTFRRPPGRSSLLPAWEAMEREFKRAKSHRVNLRDIYAVLLSPPFGMKKAVIPVFLAAGLLAYADEIAIYEHGTFKPLLTPEISQRMVSNPRHFDIKHFANTSGARREVIDELAARLGVKPRFRKHRVTNVLAIVGYLIARVNRLENYTRRTHNLGAPTRAARDVLLSAVEPDDLLFATLPQALGFSPIDADIDSYPQAAEYARAVADAADELTNAYGQLLDRLLHLLLADSAETSRAAITGQATALVDEVLDPEVRPFVLTLANDSIESDIDWIKAIATVVGRKAPAEWRDDDLKRFEIELPRKISAFRRLLALHNHHRADGGGPFNIFRVTFTSPDGREDVRLVSIDQDERDHLDQALDTAITELAAVMHSPQQAQESLLALLGERLLPSPSAVEPLRNLEALSA